MSKRKLLIILSLLIVLGLFNVKAQTYGIYALDITKELSSDKYLGRQAGTLEEEKLLNFIKSELIKNNIPENLIYFQKFPLDVYLLEEEPKLEVISHNKVILRGIYRKDFRDILTGTWNISGKIEFVGYGLKFENYKNVKDKIAIAKLGYENSKDKNLDRVDYRTYLSYYNGGKGIILVLDKNKEFIVSQKALFLNNYPIPVIYITSNFQEKLEKLYKEDSNLEISYTIKYKTLKNNSSNIFALINGKEDKYIILSAHMDHVGKDFDGSFFPGANDNALSVGVLLEIIKIIKEKNITPKYNLVFAFFNGEEYGLKGSSYYVKNPIFPLNKLLLNINIDCIGRGEYLYLIYNNFAESYVEKMKKIDENLNLLGEHPLITQSDQYSFYSLKLPVIFITRASGDLFMPDLHQKTDTFEKISYHDIEEVIDLLIKFITNN
ncbi:MAG: hypothetical protein CBR30_06255 [Dictyoglomus sp. NZ13-RE01]|nr:MAG: hypothetical protein CBR30_06255 [Dictyoglomus sp. NZ13-RE01]